MSSRDVAHEFPPTSTLGRTIDCTIRDVNLGDASKILAASNANHVIEWGPSKPWTISNTGYTFEKPENITAQYLGSNTAHDLYADTGENLVKKLSASANVSASYMAVSAKIEGSFAYKTTIDTKMQYGFLWNSQDLYSAALAGNQLTHWKQSTPGFRQAMLALPVDVASNPQKFADFVALWGTHLVTNVTYGTRFEFAITCSSFDTTGKVSLKACIAAEYGSLVEVKADVTVKASMEWQQYQKVRETTANVIGGDPQYSLRLASHPTNPDYAKDWESKNRGVGFEALVHMTTIPLGDLLIHSSDAHEKAIGQALNSYIDIRVNTRYIPKSKVGYGPYIIAWSPSGGVGTVTLALRGDQRARFTDVPEIPNFIDVFDGGRIVQVTFGPATKSPYARYYAAIPCGIECGTSGTDVEFSGSGDSFACFTANHNYYGDVNRESKFNFLAKWVARVNGSPYTFRGVDLCSTGMVPQIGGNFTRIKREHRPVTGVVEDMGGDIWGGLEADAVESNDDDVSSKGDAGEVEDV